MALLRLTLAIAAAMLAACSQAGAQPSERSGLSAPAGWQPLPELAASAAKALAADKIRVDGFEAWGELAKGCYGVWLALHGDGASAQQVLAGIEAEGIEVSDVVKPEASDGLVAATFTRTIATTVWRGRLRARIAAGKITALACFANDREPGACELACTTLLGGLP